MFIVTFIILKLTGVLILSWWWIILAMFLDMYVEQNERRKIQALTIRIEELENAEESRLDKAVIYDID